MEATTLRSDLEQPMPVHMRNLPVDSRGYPVPWFVGWIDGVPEFRAMDGAKFRRAVKERLCWVCGAPLGRWLAFPIGPMCAITRTTAEPPSHRDCAEWSIRNCPFLSEPRMVRRSENLPEAVEAPAGFGIMRNPGVICLWMTRVYEIFNDGHNRPLITVGGLEAISWWAEKRQATRAEVEASIESGLPILMTEARREGPFAVEQLAKQVAYVRALLPAV